jgi:hypothetical protein
MKPHLNVDHVLLEGGQRDPREVSERNAFHVENDDAFISSEKLALLGSVSFSRYRSTR